MLGIFIPKRYRIALILVMLVAILTGLAIYFLRPYPAVPEDLQQVYNNPEVSITENDGWYQIEPITGLSDRAIIFYPGGLVSADAYLYKLSDLAIKTNQRVYVVKFPLSLAVTNINAATRIIETSARVETWTLMGHSLGGAMACRYALDNPDVINFLILQASYCDQSIADTNIQVLSMYGSLDGVLNMEQLDQYRVNLPQDALIEVIPGMNHAQFGNYGDQAGDNAATISDDNARLMINLLVESVIE